MPHALEAAGPLSEAELVRRALLNDEPAIRSIIQLHNRRLFRVARSIVKDDCEAEDVLQEAYLKAFSTLASFRGEAKLSTWLTRIVVNEALQRLRRRAGAPDIAAARITQKAANVLPFPLSGDSPLDPERIMAQRELTQLVVREIDQLPLEFRTVLVARILEGMSVEETAEALDLKPETVKTRLHRARRLLRAALVEHVEPMLDGVFPFDGARCARLTEAVIAKLKERA